MLISKQREFIFIHIYKNAGTSILNALMPFAANKWQRMAHRISRRLHLPTRFDPNPFPDHIKASEIINAIGKETFDSYFSFAIIRNPWDWQVSLYNYILKTPPHHQHQVVKALGSFDEYIRWRCKEEEVRFQKDFIYSKNDELLVDFVGRFEKLDTDFKAICSRIGISASLPKLNVSNTKPYRQFYSNETKELVRRAFDADIKLLGYDF